MAGIFDHELHELYKLFRRLSISVTCLPSGRFAKISIIKF